MKKYLAVILTLVLVLAGCGTSSDTYTQLLSTQVESLDPSQSVSYPTFLLMTDIYVGPTRIDSDNQEVNLGAESIEVSEDGLTYTINLRDNIKWVDNTGTELGNVTAEDYVFGYRRMVDPQVASGYSYIFEDINNAAEITAGEVPVEQLGVEAVDDYTLKISLNKPVPYFTNLLAFGSFVAQPQGAYEMYGDDFATSAETMWYDGPYYVTEYDTDYVIELQKNPLYFNQDQVAVENVEYRLNTDDTSRLNAMTNDEADYAELDTIENVKLAEEKGILSSRPTMFSYYLVLNTSAESPTSNQNLREALSIGFDRETIVNSVFEGVNTPIEYIVPANLTTASYGGLDYRDVAGSSMTSYDGDLANKYFDKYMEDAGITDRSQIELDILINSDSSDSTFAEVVQAFYKEQYGITINIDESPSSMYKEKRRAGGFDILYTDWAPDYGDPSTYLALWKSSNIGSQNYAMYDNEQYDTLYEQADQLTEPEARFKAFAKCEQKLIDDGVLVPLYQKNQGYIINPNYEMPDYVLFLLSHEYLTATE